MKLYYDGAAFETSPIGSRREVLRVYLIREGESSAPNWRGEKDNLLFCTGCFAGYEKQFRSAIFASYPEGDHPSSMGHVYRREYLAAIDAAREYYRLKALAADGLLPAWDGTRAITAETQQYTIAEVQTL